MALIEVEVNLDDLASDLASQCLQHKLIEFMLNVDAHVADVRFTESLIKRLEEVLDEEG